MKLKLFLTTTILISFQLLFSFHLQSQSKLLINSIEYDVPIFNELSYDISYGKEYSDWWDRNIETSRRSSFQKAIIEKATKGEIKVYNDEGNILTLKDINQILSSKDTVKYQRTSVPFDIYDTIITARLYTGDIQYLRFKEQWYFDTNTFKISKQISEYAPVWVECNHDNKKTGKSKALYWIKYNKSSQKNFKPLTDLIGYCISLDNDTVLPNFIKFKSISDDTLLLSQYFYSLINNAENGKIKIYEYSEIENFFNYNIDSAKALLQNEVYLKFNFTDSVQLQKQEPPYYFYDSLILTKLDTCKILGLKFLERWFIDEKTLEINKEILGFVPYFIRYDYKERYLKKEEMFYYSFAKPFRYFELK